MPQSRTFHNLSAGSTTIMPDGKVIRFGGKIERVEGGTKVGTGTYTTSDPTEIGWLEALCKVPSPQVWEEVSDETAIAPTPQVAAGLQQETQNVQQEVVERAALATDPKVVALMNKLGNLDSNPDTPAA